MGAGVIPAAALDWASRVGRAAVAALSLRWPLLLIVVGARLLYEAMGQGNPGHGGIAGGRALLAVTCGGLAAGCFWLATRPRPPGWLQHPWRRLPAWARWPLWRVAFILSVLWLPWSNFLPQLGDAFAGRYHNDAIAYVHMDAELLRQGVNPYTSDGAFWVAAVRWPRASATPLLGGPLWGGDPRAYPTTPAQIQELLTEANDPAARGGNFAPATVHNYPAGIVLLALPLIWAGLPSVTILNFLAVLAILALVLARARESERLAALVVLLASPVLFLAGMIDDFDAVCIVFVLAAWHFSGRSRLSPLLLGIAGAVKQLAWFFVPFYLLEVWRREGAAAALRRAGWVALGFGVPNLPFIVLSPGAWLHSLFVPMTTPMFPIGYGLISLALGGLLPFGSAHVWTALEALAALGLLILVAARRTITADGLLLALAPLWFAWRSPMDYFALVPTLALWLALDRAPAIAAVPAPQAAPAPDLAAAAI